MSTTEIRVREPNDSSKEEYSTFDKASIPVEEEDFAQMNGISVNDRTTEDQLTTQLQLEVPEAPEPEEIITTRGVFQQPWIKAVVVGSGGLLIFGILGLMANSGFNAISNTNSAPSPQITSATETQNNEENQNQPKDDTGETKTALALTSQKGELQNLNFERTPNTNAPAKSFPSPTPTLRPQPRQTYNRQPSQSSGFSSRSTPVVKTAPPPPPRIQAPVASVLPKASPPSQAAPVDPNQQWLAASNVGSFSASATTDTASDDLNDVKGIEGGTGTSKPLTAKTVALNKVDKQLQGTESENITYNSKRVLVGSRAIGSLETPIAWSNEHEIQANQKYLIQLSQPLKASDGSEALPKGAYIVAQVSGASKLEYVQLQAVSALVNSDGNTQEKSLPEGVISILSKSGKLLKAESRKGSDLGGSLFSSVIAGVAKAAQIQNNPTSQITTSSYGFSSSTTTNDNKDLAAGFTEGVLGEILQGVQSQNQQLQGTDKVFVIEAGKSVQIFVNQSINL
ncbi:hypothetical protein WKK05_37625 (plasmid) [Nostoc sp. UHCC 0302]|uniref:hypothetical protein n=1 Tax=Nostoc sp. UHCC 0302 TaxID=3134896 RepID=UPI00311CC064